MSASAPGPPHRSGEGRPLRGIPRSRAFWELKAEQMMNRIFDPEEPIDLAVEPPPQEPQPWEPAPTEARGPEVVASASGSASMAAAAPAAAAASSSSATAAAARVAADPLRPRTASRRSTARTPAAAAAPARGSHRLDERLVLIGALCGVCMVSVAGSLIYFGYWNRLQQSLSQERNLLLVERLRSLGPANPSPVSGPDPATPALPSPTGSQATAQAGADGLPPPPPDEPWIQQLSSLPQASPAPAPASSPRPSRVLTVPVSPRLAAAAPAPAAPTAPLPQLVGVVAGGGRSTSGIFLVGGSSMSVSSGEQIGSSGWRLRSAEGETALIERGGEVRQVSIISGNGF